MSGSYESLGSDSGNDLPDFTRELQLRAEILPTVQAMDPEVKNMEILPRIKEITDLPESERDDLDEMFLELIASPESVDIYLTQLRVEERLDKEYREQHGV